jgi:co-chaperonin GroES (HSP10)
MNFNPYNRHVLLKKSEKKPEEKKSTVLVPESYSTTFKPYEVYEVVDIAKDCEKISLGQVSKRVVVPNNMVEKIDVDGNELLLVLENHIYGVIEK